MKHKLNSYERPFKVKKDGVFPFSDIFPRSRDMNDFVLCKLDN